MQKMKELPEHLNHERGHVIYEPEMGNMEFGIAKATDESNWPVTEEMVRRYNAHVQLEEEVESLLDLLARIAQMAEDVLDDPRGMEMSCISAIQGYARGKVFDARGERGMTYED